MRSLTNIQVTAVNPDKINENLHRYSREQSSCAAAANVRIPAYLAGHATAASGELSTIADEYGTAVLQAEADRARGAVLLTAGDARGALVALRAAWQAWRELDAPYEAARVRVLIGQGCRALGDDALELDSARRVFAQLSAAPDLARAGTLSPDPHRLVRRHGAHRARIAGAAAARRRQDDPRHLRGPDAGRQDRRPVCKHLHQARCLVSRRGQRVRVTNTDSSPSGSTDDHR